MVSDIEDQSNKEEEQEREQEEHQRSDLKFSP
jgi:hypothetical protein